MAMNVLKQQLLQSLVAPDSESESRMEDLLLAQLGNADPRVKLLVQLLAQNQAETHKDDPDLGDDEVWDVLPESDLLAEDHTPTRKPQRSFTELKQIVQDMYTELDELRELNDTLAAALGACYLCWGNDSGCEVCHGKGLPGASLPDKAAFMAFIAPAIRRLRMHQNVQPRRNQLSQISSGER